jgi:4-amino-4-deoxy-L-arabinose transferase-like glycosyltransferase
MMIDANTVTENEVRERPPKTEARSVSPLWNWLSLGGIMLISLFMNFYQLGQGNFGNPYYAAGVRSMLDSLHNFFFVSYDPGGFVTIDKPPLGFWLQTLSAKVFGFTPFSVYLPQALAGVISVLLLYHLVQRHFGKVAGLLAALALALSPISVVTNRNNTIDSTLTLVLLLGAWAVIRAAETGRLRWLLVCAMCVGLGFNIKMLQAYLVVPAFGLLYLVAVPRKIWTRIWHLFVAIVVLLVISLSWMVVVDLTPASQRPYVGSSQDNSEISLAIGYNGINRLLSDLRFRGNRGEQQSGAANVTSPVNNGATNQPNGTQQERANVFGGGGGGAFSQGMAGPFRLFDQELGGQIAWLLPISLLAIVAVAWQRKWRLQEDRRLQSMVVWGIWLLTMGIFFSVAGFFHQYYLTTMAPAVAALFGIGIVTMWGDYRAGGWRGWLLPVAIAITVVTQLSILSSYPTWSQWLSPLIGILGAVVVLALLVLRLIPVTRNNVRMLRQVVAALSLGVAVLLIAPTVWAGYSVINNTESQIPTAGPNPQNTALRFGGDQGFPGGRDFPGGQGMLPGGPIVTGGQGGQFRMRGENTTVNAALISYLESNRGNAKYLLAVPSSMSANSIILATNQPVMALGGFAGSDPILTADQLASLVKAETVRFFLLMSGLGNPVGGTGNEQSGTFVGPGGDGGGFFGGQQSSLTAWVQQSCTVVPASKWLPSSVSTGNSAPGYGLGVAETLYDCAAAK